MFDKIKTAQFHCYLGQVDWQALEKACGSLMGPEAVLIKSSNTSLEWANPDGRLLVERFLLRPELLPWQYELSLYLYRPESPVDPWRNLWLARQLARQLGTESWCDPPQPEGLFPSGRWKLHFSFWQNKLVCQLAELEERDIEWVDLKELTPVDFRNFELYHAELPLF